MKPEQTRRLIDRWEREFNSSWMGAVEGIKLTLSIKRLTQLLDKGDIQGALKVASRGMSKWVAEHWIKAFESSASASALYIQRALGVPITYEGTNFKAVASLGQQRLRLVRGFSAQQTEATMNALQEAFTTGANPREVARAFRDSIGLTPNQEQAVRNYKRLLRENNREALTRELRDHRFDPSLRAALRSKVPLTEDHIGRMVDRYRDRMLKYRSETIARTESLRSVHMGQDEMYRQAIDEGELAADQLEREWNTAKDERVRASHSDMHGQKRGPLDPFTSGLGNPLRFPGDPDAPAEDTVLCRCAVGTRITKIVIPA